MNDMPDYLRCGITFSNPRDELAPNIKQKLALASAKGYFGPLCLAWTVHHATHDSDMREICRTPKAQIKLLQLVLNLRRDFEDVRPGAPASRA
jgi:hypothetical protein